MSSYLKTASLSVILIYCIQLGFSQTYQWNPNQGAKTYRWNPGNTTPSPEMKKEIAQREKDVELAKKIIGTWTGTMVGADQTLLTVSLNIHCYVEGTIQGEWFYFDPSSSLQCREEIVGTYSNSGNYGKLNLKTYKITETGNNHCVHFSANLNQNSSTLKGRTDGGFYVNLKRGRAQDIILCPQKLDPNMRPVKSYPRRVGNSSSVTKKAISHSCKCCNGRGYSQLCAACNGLGTVSVYNPSLGYNETHSCGGISCSRGRISCYCCHGSGKE